jgi:chromosome segregation ATPase
MPKPTEGPLAAAALAIETELDRFEHTIDELDGIAITSEKTLQRAGRALQECAQHEEKLATLLPTLAAAMGNVQERQTSCLERTARATEKLKERFEKRSDLVASLASVGNQAQEINQTGKAFLEGNAEKGASNALAELAQQLEGVIADVSRVEEQAKADGWSDVAREAEGLKGQLQSARNRVLLAHRSLQ